MKHRTLFTIIVLLLATSWQARAQWQQVSGPAIGTIPSAFGGFGFIHYKDGIVWAGRENLYRSNDSGATWTQVPNLFTGTIAEINFFDTQIGVIATTAGVYKTTNGGGTWGLILDRSNAYGAQFAGSASRIVAATDGNSSGFYYSNNGGATWNYRSSGAHPHFVLTYSNGTAYAQTGSNIYFTSDLGVTWQQKGGIDYDSWYLVQDSSQYLFLMNEEGHVFADNKASFCRSSDGAVSWQNTTAFDPQYYTGGISASKCAVYCQTLANGVVRSTDQGVTWTSIGGPNNYIDTRLVCAVNSQIVIAADVNGQLWRTTNSGGASMPQENVEFVLAKPKEVAITVCDYTDLIPIDFELSSSCSGKFLRVTAIGLGGANPGSFTLTSQQPPFTIYGNTPGTISVRFTAGNTPGDYSAVLHITGYYQDAQGNKTNFDTTIALNAKVLPAAPKLSSIGAVLFPPMTPCDTDRDTVVTLTNNGCDTLMLLSGPGNCPPGFSFDSLAYPLLLPPGHSIGVHFYFDPADTGKHTMNAIFEAESNGVKQFLPVTLTGNLRGENPQLFAKDTALAFRSMTKCDPERDTTITLTNIGCDTLRILSGPGTLSNGFSIDSLKLPLILAPGQSITLQVHFDAPDTGSYGTRAIFTSMSLGQYDSLAIDLSGLGRGVVPKLQADKAALDFGSLSTCDKLRDTTIILTNTGCDTLFITSGPGSLPPEFTMSNVTLPIVLPPDSTITLRFTFMPSGDGTSTATATFLSERDGLTGSVSLLLSGFGIEGKGVLATEPKTLPFDPLAICFRDSLPGFITNTGCDTLILDGATLIGDADFDCVNLPTLPFALAPGDTIYYLVHLSPLAKGNRSGILTIEAHSAHGTKTPWKEIIPISGDVVNGNKLLSAIPDTFDFGTTTICDSPDSMITLINRGCDTLTITSAMLTGSGFQLNATPPIIILPGQQISIPVSTVIDTANGIARNIGRVTFVSDADNGMIPIYLSRRYIYPKRHTIELRERSAKGSAGDPVRFEIYTKDDLVGVTQLDFDLKLNTDLLGFISTEGPNTITFINGHIRITGSPIVADSGVLGSLLFHIYLTKDSVTEVSIANLQLNGGDAYFERCIASAGQVGADFSYIFRCGERTLSKYMRGVQIFSVIAVRPNPTSSRAEVLVDVQRPTTLTISVLDMLGRKVSEQSSYCIPGRNAVDLPIETIVTGIYYLEVTDGITRTTTSFTKTR